MATAMDQEHQEPNGSLDEVGNFSDDEQTIIDKYPAKQIIEDVGYVPRGLTVSNAAFFIIGEIAGSGILALPYAITSARVSGFALLLFAACVSGFCGIVLAWTWVIIRKKCPEYQGHVRHPYPAIALKAVGRKTEITVTVCLTLTLMGACTVFLLLSAQNLSKLIHLHLPHVEVTDNFRIWLLIVAAVLLPLTQLGTPKDFWLVPITATLATCVAGILICSDVIVHYPKDAPKELPHTTFQSFFSAFGTILFSYGGISIFPTIQTDMKKPSHFPRSIVYSYLAITFLIYFPPIVLGFVAYGKDVHPNILVSLAEQKDKVTTVLVDLAIGLTTAHFMFAFVIVMNPISQQLEELCRIPPGFNPLRCLVRVGVLLFILGLAEAVPKFDVVMSLVGGSLVTLLTFVFPCIFYLRVKPNLPLHVKAILYEIIGIGIVGGLASTYSAIDTIAKG